MFATMFRAAQVHVLLQDGMGARNADRGCYWAESDYLPQMAAYETAVRKAMGSYGWVNAESFEQVQTGVDPTTSWRRFDLQLRSVPSNTPIVTFDYLANMNPVGGSAAAKQLYRRYVQAIGKGSLCDHYLSEQSR